MAGIIPKEIHGNIPFDEMISGFIVFSWAE
jgi:hypothetical protein